MNQPCDFCDKHIDETLLTEYNLDGERYEICPECLDAELYTFEGELRAGSVQEMVDEALQDF